LENLLSRTGLLGDIEDAAVISVPNSDLALVKNLDIFTPIVDEPQVMGEISACNVTNDIFALNVPEISGMLVFLAIKTDTPEYISEGILKGIKNFMENKINSKVVGGHTIYCEWPLIGGEASGFVEENKIIKKSGVRKGDKLIITKPIGLQAITAAYRILKEMPELLETFSRTEIEKSIEFAIELMTTSNQNVVKTIHQFSDMTFVHAMSDITGFGLSGHLKEMLQHSELAARIEKIPGIKLSKELSNELGYAYDECQCAETAGGMLIAVAPEFEKDFRNALTSNKISNWTVGTIYKGKPRSVRVSEDVIDLDIEKI
jgi:selenide,water dikinase